MGSGIHCEPCGDTWTLARDMTTAVRKRILLFDLPRLLRDLITATVDREPDLEIVGAVDDEVQLAATVARAEPDVLIVRNGESALPEVTGALLGNRPALRILALAYDGGSGFMWELAPRRALGQMSPVRLLTAIREPGAWRWEP